MDNESGESMEPMEKNVHSIGLHELQTELQCERTHRNKHVEK